MQAWVHAGDPTGALPTAAGRQAHFDYLIRFSFLQAQSFGGVVLGAKLNGQLAGIAIAYPPGRMIDPGSCDVRDSRVRHARGGVGAREHVVQRVDGRHVAARVPELDLVVVAVVVDRADDVHVRDGREALERGLDLGGRGLARERRRGVALEAQAEGAPQRRLARPHALRAQRRRLAIRLAGQLQGDDAVQAGNVAHLRSRQKLVLGGRRYHGNR